MNMGSRKVNTEGIDEELLIASIGRRKQDGTLYRAQELPAPAPEEESVPESEQPSAPSPARYISMRASSTLLSRRRYRSMMAVSKGTPLRRGTWSVTFPDVVDR